MATDEQTETFWRREIDARPDRPADVAAEAVGAAVVEAIAQGHFTEFLRSHGWALVHTGDEGCPEPPSEWLHDGLALFGEAGATRLVVWRSCGGRRGPRATGRDAQRRSVAASAAGAPAPTWQAG